MAQPQPGSRYDMTPLVPLLEAGWQLLTPNLRLARRIRAEWNRLQAASGLKVWSPPAVQPLEAWLRQQWASRCLEDESLRRVPLEQGQALVLWQRIIADDQQQSGYQLLQDESAASLAQQARDYLLCWNQRIGDEALADELKLSPDCAAFLRWCRAFEAALEEGGFATGTDCIRLLADSPPSAGGKVALVAFDTVPPLFKQCLQKLAQELDEVSLAPRDTPREAREYPDRQRELQAVARWAHAVYQSEPEASIGIVLGDMRGDRARLEYLLRREFDCLAANYDSLPVNFSTGWPLAEVPVIRDALMALGMTAQRVPLNHVLALLRSRFLQLPDRHSPLALAFIARLFDNVRDPVEAITVRNLASQLTRGEQRGLRLGEILLQAANNRELRQSALPSIWVDRFSELLTLWGWPGDGGLDSLEYQQVSDWYKLLETFAAYDGVCGRLSLTEALSLLTRCCRDTMFQPETQDSRLQVLGPLEAAGLQFDHLWLVGMQGSQWPAPARPNPLLPVALQQRLAMPHASAEREWEYSESLLSQYQRCAGRLYASYSREQDGAPELPSALLEGFDWVEDVPPGDLPDSWSTPWRAREMEVLADHQAPPVDDEELASIGGGSALLEDQSNCPFRAFAYRRLNTQPLAEPVLALTAAERGTLLHGALYALWGELDNRDQLEALDITSEQALIERSVAAAFDGLHASRRQAVGNAYCEQERAHLAKLLGEWLAVERQRAQFEIANRESKQPMALGPLRINLKLDRVDRLEDGSLMIIDYKSGRGSTSDWVGERPGKPQLPLYSLVGDADGEAPLAALAFAQVRPRECKFVGLGKAETAPGIKTDIAKAADQEDWEALLASWRQTLHRLAEEFIGGDATVDPLRNSCTYCGLQALCRVDIPVEEGA